MKHGDAIQSVTHVSDVNRYPCSGLNTAGGATARRQPLVRHLG
jgi:hypothetical protein